MTVGIMQPYFLPYIGYWQLIQAVDKFVVYDNIKFTKKGWINRNRFLQNGKEALFSLPVKNDSDALDVVERELAQDFDPAKLISRFREAYRKAPYFHCTMPLLESIFLFGGRNLFQFIFQSILRTRDHLEIATDIIVSSEIAIDHGLKGQEKVLAICGALGAKTYINSIGGAELYSSAAFSSRGIELRFLKPMAFVYPQYANPFVAWLSIADVLMFNSRVEAQQLLTRQFELI